MKLKERLFITWRKQPVILSLCAAALALALLSGGYLGITAALDPYDYRILDGVTIGGLDAGGMTKGEARKSLNAALEETLYAQALTVRLPAEALTLSPEESGVRVSVWKAVNAAYALGRNEDAETREISLLPFLKVDEAAVRSLLTQYASAHDTVLTQPAWELTGDRPALSTAEFDPETPGQTLVLTMGIPTMTLDVPQVYGEILAAFAKAIPLCQAGTFSVTPEVTAEALPEMPDLDAIYSACAAEPVDDSLDMARYVFVPGAYGYGFDLEEARALVENADFGQTLTIPMAGVEPEILGEEVYFRDVLGHCETKHNTDENRNTNLRLLCQALDGVIIQPGEEFSYNGTVGERTEEKGYKPATAYSGSRMDKDIGGGVCQGSTTLYNCALLADLEILERVCHGASVTYIQPGLDAAVNWNTKTDLRFRNNFHFPIMIKAEVADGYVKMQLLGTDEKDYYVEMHCGVGKEGSATYAVSYKYKYDKETGELLSKDVEARSSYYTLDD